MCLNLFHHTRLTKSIANLVLLLLKHLPAIHKLRLKSQFSFTHWTKDAHSLWGPLFKVSVNDRIKVTVLFFSQLCFLPLNWILTILSSWPGKVICFLYLRITMKEKGRMTINMVFWQYYALFPLLTFLSSGYHSFDIVFILLRAKPM